MSDLILECAVDLHVEPWMVELQGEYLESGYTAHEAWRHVAQRAIGDAGDVQEAVARKW